jgi:transcriptional regulator
MFGPPIMAKRFFWTKNMITTLIRMRTAHYSLQEIASKLGTSRGVVKRCARKNGVDTKSTFQIRSRSRKKVLKTLRRDEEGLFYKNVLLISPEEFTQLVTTELRQRLGLEKRLEQ